MAVEIDPASGSTFRVDLAAADGGWFHGTLPATAGDRYRLMLDGWISRPDPASRFQPEGVHGPSQIVHLSAHAWNDHTWSGIAKEDLVLYEVHIGAWTNEGTFQSAIDRLDEVVRLGASTVELLPLAQTPGRWNWGYDGVGLFAPQHEYGHPADLQRFVDACHARGLAVILDVVYNHLGPEGNYLGDFGPYFSRRHKTPWGPSFNFDRDLAQPVRDFVIQNVLYWLREFHFDGLRLDAIRFMRDRSPNSIFTEIREAVDGLSRELGRPLHLIGETNVHDPQLVAPPERHGHGFPLLWNDEIPHALFAQVLGQERIASRTYHGAEDLLTALQRGYLYQIDPATGDPFRSPAGAPPAAHESTLQGLQTHDQVGNHPEGLRLHALSSLETQKAAAALILLHPAIPLMFMGEEFASPTPFCFFVDYGDPHLRNAVVEGRRRDYDHHDWDRMVSPVAEEAFYRSKLPPAGQGTPGMLAWYTTLLAQRRQWRSSGLLRSAHLRAGLDETRTVFALEYATPAGATAWVAVRLDPPQNAPQQPVQIEFDGELLVWSEEKRFGGESSAPEPGATSLLMTPQTAAAGGGRLLSPLFSAPA